MNIDELIEQKVREIVARELEPLRSLLLKPIGEAEHDVDDLVDAIKVAEMMGKDVSDDKKARASAQTVYNLARRNIIPSVRISPRRIKFDPRAVKRWMANGGFEPQHRKAS